MKDVLLSVEPFQEINCHKKRLDGDKRKSSRGMWKKSNTDLWTGALWWKSPMLWNVTSNKEAVHALQFPCQLPTDWEAKGTQISGQEVHSQWNRLTHISQRANDFLSPRTWPEISNFTNPNQTLRGLLINNACVFPLILNRQSGPILIQIKVVL